MNFPRLRKMPQTASKIHTPRCGVDHPQALRAHIICGKFIPDGKMSNCHLDVRAVSRHTKGKQTIQIVVMLKLTF